MSSTGSDRAVVTCGAFAFSRLDQLGSGSFAVVYLGKQDN
eukprot:gene11287-3326_t